MATTEDAPIKFSKPENDSAENIATLSPYGEFGLHVAVLASVVSCAIILLMSLVFITCCVHDCTKKKRRGKQEREAGLSHREEGNDPREKSRSGHKSRKNDNNNNNNSHDRRTVSLWDGHDTAFPDDETPRRSFLHPDYDPTVPLACSFELATPLPGQGYNRPLIAPNIGLAHFRSLPFSTPHLPHT